MRCTWALTMLAAAVLAAPAHGSFFHRSRNGGGRAGSIALRERLHVNPLITDPSTVELDWGFAYSATSSGFSLPATIRYTPEGGHVWWGRTEFSASFDTLSSVVQDDVSRATHFSDRVTFAATAVVHDGARFDVAFAPQVTVLVRGDHGTRLGGTAIARYDWGMNSAGATASWTAATAASDTNPAGTFDFGVGYGRRLATRGAFGHLTAHTNLLYERSTGVPRQVSLFEGIEYQVTSRLAVDFSGQHFAVWGGTRDHQFTVGLTYSTPRLRKGH